MFQPQAYFLQIGMSPVHQDGDLATQYLSTVFLKADSVTELMTVGLALMKLTVKFLVSYLAPSWAKEVTWKQFSEIIGHRYGQKMCYL